MTVSATLAINELTTARLEAGEPLVPLGFGQAGVPVQPELVEALRAAAPAADYGPVAGIPSLREAAAGYWMRRGLPTDPDSVLAGPGSKALLYAVLQASNGAVALPRPSWVSYAAQAALLGRPAEHVPTPLGEGGVPDPEALAAAAEHARRSNSPIRTLIVTLPDNPTGTLARPATIRAVCEIARAHHMLIVCDEIYRDLVHDPERSFLSPAEVAPERTVVTTGLSKNLAAGGWRIGVARMPEGAFGDAVRDAVASTASEIWSSPAQPVQRAAAWALTEPAPVRARIERSRFLHAHVLRAVTELFRQAGARVDEPEAAFYSYPDFEPLRDRLVESWSVATGADLATVLLHELGVAALPGSAFGDLDDRLTLRIATSMLYGSPDQAEAALVAADPVRLPWIASQLQRLAAALATLTDER